MATCLLALPVAIYMISYIPWAFLDSHQLFAGWPPGHTGQTLRRPDRRDVRLPQRPDARPTRPPRRGGPGCSTSSRSGSTRSGFAGDTTAAIYDAGNLVVWWLGDPGDRLRRVAGASRGGASRSPSSRSASPCQWVSWARIDRAAFQYHYYTSAAVPLPRPRLLPRRAVARRVAPDLAPRAESPPRWRSSGRPLLWLFDGRSAASSASSAVEPGLAGLPADDPRQFVLTRPTLAFAVVVGVTGARRWSGCSPPARDADARGRPAASRAAAAGAAGR